MNKMIRIDKLESLLIRLGLLRQSYDAIMREVSYLEVPAIPISENATNGDVIRKLFPNDYAILFDRSVSSFWNAPYKGGQEDGKGND